jgi:hypothetical protein
VPSKSGMGDRPGAQRWRKVHHEEGQTKLNAFKIITNQQKEWVTKRGIKLDGENYVNNLNDNLYSPLLPEVRTDYQSGDGNELRKNMRAPHSSSALVVNFFQYWKQKNINEIAEACGAPNGMTDIRFERKRHTKISIMNKNGKPPNLDIEFTGNNLNPLAIESKFREPYSRKKAEIDDKYLTSSLWEQLPKCEELIIQIKKEEQEKTSFSYLDASQLLKHILGLTTEYGVKNFQLLYLWYNFPSPEADKHKSEIDFFKVKVKDDVYFNDMTYQKLFRKINKSTADSSYLDYLRKRYFPDIQS